MKNLLNSMCAALTLLIVTSAQAVIIVSNDYVALEGTQIEILHNAKEQSGRVIVHRDNCGGCKPLSLTYSGALNFSINGYLSTFDPDGQTIGRGDVSYKPDDMTVGHINFYQ